MIGAPTDFHFLGICGTAMGSVASADKGCQYCETIMTASVYRVYESL